MPSSRSSRRVLFATIPLLVSLACATSPSATPLSSAGSIDGSARTTVVGPERGSLVIAGGGALGPEIIERFISLAGGPDARIVVIPTAGGADSYAPDWNGLALLRNAGATRLTVLHTNSRREADAEQFVKAIREARGVWFPGGRQWRLVDSYLGTRTERELHALLDRGGVVGGTSAGASIMASYLVRGAREGNQVMMARGYEKGFSFMRGTAIDQHVVPRNRLGDLPTVLRVHPTLLGIGLDEGTAIVVQGDRFEVVGKSRVFVYGGRDPVSAPYLELQPGDRYDMGARLRVGRQIARIDRERLLGHVRTLAADSFAGRKVATRGGEMARRYVSDALREAGLSPVGGSFDHSFRFGPDSAPIAGVNVVGHVRGARYPSRYIVVSAHFDHVGIGRPVNGDSIYNGADDNASGTSALIEVARHLAANPPQNSVIFVGFDAEESGLGGARAFVENPPVPRDSIIMNINMDMVSRSEKNELYAVGSYAYPVLRPYIEQAMASSTVKLLTGHEGPGVARTDDWTNQSDQGAFNARGIPFIYFGVEDHPGYHRPSDEFAFITPTFYVGAVETVLDALLALDRDLAPVAAVRR